MLTRLLARVRRPRPPRLPAPSPAEQAALRELRDFFSADRTPSASDAAWVDYSRQLAELMRRDDPRRFLQWPPITDSMFVGNAPYIADELEYLQRRDDWNCRWQEALRESPIGRPDASPHWPSSSGNLIHHAYHLAQFEARTGVRIDRHDTIVEFGGGYGSMCRLVFNLGFRGTYIILDLPPFMALQRYFLRASGIPAAAGGTVLWAAGADDVRAQVRGETMLLATWSLSEMPLSVRRSLMPLRAVSRSFLIAYRDRFGGVDNVEYFRDWRQSDPAVAWHHWPIDHLPGNEYLMGVRA